MSLWQHFHRQFTVGDFVRSEAIVFGLGFILGALAMLLVGI